MAKGRKLTTSRGERFLGSLGYNHEDCGTANSASELGEEDVWSAADDAVYGDDHSGNGQWSERSCTGRNGSFSSHGSGRPPPLADRQVGGLSLAFESSSNSSSRRTTHQPRPQDGMAESPHGLHLVTSAPVKVPDLSENYRGGSVGSLHDSNGLDDSELVPPHEYLARELARSRRMPANSVFEGVGRTLKGRDMSRVRDDVWSQTGFNG